MKKFVVAAAVAAFGFGGTASAADMPTKAPMVAPIAAPMYNWSGFYIGGDVGWQGSTIDLSRTGPVAGTLTYAPHHTSVAFGGFAGYQHQFGQFVLGIEGGYTAATGSGDLGPVPSVDIFIPGGTGTSHAKLKDIWNVGGRAGYAIGPAGNWLPYVTGGYASGRFAWDAQSTAFTESADARANGAYFGGGVDWAWMNNKVFGSDVILGIEYRHYWFGTTDAGGAISTGTPITIRFEPKTDVVMGRVSFKFGGL